MKKALSTVIFILFYLFSYGQTLEKVIIAQQDPYDLYATNDQDSTKLFYLKLVPKDKPIGALVILPGSGERIEDVMKQITLHKLAIEKNILVIFPSINWGTNKHDVEHQLLDTIFKQVTEQYRVPKDKFILGGFSGGAMLSLTYTQKANRSTNSTYLIPKAVFGVDPPLDYAHLWDHCKRDIERNISVAAVQEGKWIMESYIKEFGGSPKEYPQHYIRYSIYSHSEKDGGNAKYLKSTPLRIYTEPDIIWQMQNRKRDLYDLNCTDISAMINLLQLYGNKDAEMIVTHDKGKRLDGSKHPHSWSIMDSADCLHWILKHLQSRSTSSK